MASRGWSCRGCATLNPAPKRKCVGCGRARPKKKVPAHKKALRDHNYESYLALNQTIHGVGEVCAVCTKERVPERKLDRDHDHTLNQGYHSGRPRGLVCVACNILMPPKLTPGKAREIAAYLTRVEEYYMEEAA